ncbi:ornithine cyclodeaminase family protein [Clostridium sp. CS001]|uniref:ornithine cyclodeaminase family protein n=1 Tax=Clostridium sp. CS001 TaxID=2880648 RepID=UPI001CF43DFF|nr:ornithine cyclodeaminase family protein [Clostridium sp. CS001]MCB2291413.1 ornithine cyclodeaminase family protein [Clostridium sp. CS001]
MLLLTKNDIMKAFTMKEAIEADKEASRMYSEGNTVVPLRLNIDIPKFEGQTLFMTGYAKELDITGVKIVSVFPKNIDKGIPSVPAQMLLVDGKTGQVLCIMDGTYLTQLRTGAISGAATDILANKDVKIMALCGTGGQAPAQLEAVLAVRNIELVKVYDINKERSEAFAAQMQIELNKYGARIVAADSIEDALENADIITTVTTTKTPVILGSLVKKGCHINGIGSYTPDMQELDLDLIKKCDKLYVDTRNGALSESGDLIIPINKGIISENDVDGELGEVILGTVQGRESEDEITIFKSVGSAILDVVVAYKIYEKAKDLNIGFNFEI